MSAMESKTDLRILKTCARLKAALLELMRRKSYELITISEISAEAGVSRKTFYSHYSTKDALFEATAYDMLSDIFGCFMYEKLEPGTDADRTALRRDAVRFFECVNEYSGDLALLYADETSAMANRVVETVIRDKVEAVHIISESGEGKMPASLMSCRVKSFFYTLINWWISQDSCTIDEAAQYTERIMLRSTANLFRYQRGAAIKHDKE